MVLVLLMEKMVNRLKHVMIGVTVEEEVAFGPENLGVPSREIRERVKKALADVRMSEYQKQSPARLSGGQKQRVAIAGVLAMQPQCIVLDEPTAMIDPKGRKEVIEALLLAELSQMYLLSLLKMWGVTLVLIRLLVLLKMY